MEEAKSERSVAKRNVTTAAKRLEGSCNRSADSDIVTAQAVALESALDDFLTKHDTYVQFISEVFDSSADAERQRTLHSDDNEELDNYKEEIISRHSSAMTVYKEYKRQQLAITAVPMTDRVRSSMKRLTFIIDRASTALSSNDIPALQSAKDDIDPYLNDMLEKFDNMNSLIQDADIAQDVDILVRRADREKAELNLKLRYLTHPSPAGDDSVGSGSDLANLVSTLQGEQAATTGTVVVTSTPAISQPASHGQLVVTIPSTDNSLTVNDTHRGNSVHSVTPSVATNHSPLLYSSSVTQHTPPTTTTSAPPVYSTHSQLSQPSLWSHSPYSHLNLSPQNIGAQLYLPNSTSNANTFGLEHPSIVNLLQSYSGTVVTDPFANIQLSNTVAATGSRSCQPLLGSNPRGAPALHTVVSAYGHTSTLPTPGLVSSTTAAPDLPMVTRPQVRFSEPYYNAYSTPNSGNYSPGFDRSMAQFSTASQHHIKRVELPDFDGERKKWPEFKAIFKHLAESAYTSEQTLAFELKRHVKAPADVLIQSVYSTRPGAYAKMWKKLGEVYDDPGACVSSALAILSTLEKPTEDFKSLIAFINEVDAVHAQLEELGQSACVSVRDVDRINNLLPMSIKMEWNRRYQILTSVEKLQPFSRYMEFLEFERAAMLRVADAATPNTKKTSGSRKSSLAGRSKEVDSEKSKEPMCLLHENASHLTAECRVFRRMSLKEKYALLRKEYACYRCFLRHGKMGMCTESSCEICGQQHNKILCFRGPREDQMNENPGDSKEQTEGTNETNPKTGALVAGSHPVALCPIMRVPVAKANNQVCVFLDSGSDASYITFRSANKLGLKPTRKLNLDVTTMGNVQTTVPTAIYEVPLRTVDGEIAVVEAYGMKEITGRVSELDHRIISNLFPGFDVKSLLRHSMTVDLLIGCDHFGLHPKKELACAGDHLSIMYGRLGACVQGTHDMLVEETKKSSTCARLIHGSSAHSRTNVCALRQHPIFENPQIVNIEGSCLISGSQCEPTEQSSQTCMSIKSEECSSAARFILGEELGTTVDPKCGACRCGKCPLVGHTYSFIEQQELDLIRRGLKYDEEARHWTATYPWIANPANLPNNYKPVLATLKRVEQSLLKDPKWSQSYTEQIHDMISRGVARKLTEQEILDWKGPVFYLSHLAVASPKSSSTPVRIVFNSSQTYKGVALNNYLAKGPDSYSNPILGILLRWREEPVAMVADIRKMFHSVHLEEIEAHCHRFLWRDLDASRDPDIYLIDRVNMGDRPASAIATEALRATAEMNKARHPEAAEFIIRSSYMDDLIDSKESTELAMSLAKEVGNVLATGNFGIKCWQFSGKDQALDGKAAEVVKTLLKGDAHETAVLGVGWRPVEDEMTQHVSLNFSPKRHGAHTQPDLKAQQVPRCLPAILTRRMVLQQVMSIFDPQGLISPFTLQGKKLLRRTWELDLGWDEALPQELHASWSTYFVNLFELEDIRYPRCLRPNGCVGDPWLILLSDGSEIAYGFAAYIRWSLDDGGYWCRLIMSKSRIAPLHKVTTPRMELNGAVLSKRGRQVIEAEMRYNFERVIHLIDSETVLNMLQKTSTRFKIYEGSRLGEIQAASGGNMDEWAWMPGEDNVADWLTRGRNPHELGPESIWWKGPPMLYKDFCQWGIRFGKQEQDERKLPGEKNCLTALTVKREDRIIDLGRFSRMARVRLVLARVLGILKAKSFRGGRTEYLTPDVMIQAETLLVKEAQVKLYKPQVPSTEIQKLEDRYKSLNPSTDGEGVVRVGARMTRYNPMTGSQSPQALLPVKSPLTRMIMKESHERGHCGRDATLAKFREKYWTPHGDKLARSVKFHCQLCKLKEAKLLEQTMGQLPEARLRPAPPFNHCMVDLLGPYAVRGEVQKRTSGKCYFVLFTDLYSRAVHMECAFGYDTSHFLLAFSRFVHIRGWPQEVYSDPGSQLVAAQKELEKAWMQLHKDQLIKEGVQSGTKWVFGPADSPWHQGAVEALVKTVKRCLAYAVNERRLTAAEYLTVSYEVANMVNERPIGYKPSSDSDLNIFTPNSLLLGRSSARNPGEWLPPADNLKTRFQLVTAVADTFWKRWCELYAPSLIRQNKWCGAGRNLKPDDVVLVSDRNLLRGKYRLARVLEVYPGVDGQVRKVSLAYKNFAPGEAMSEYKGVGDTVITRAVQRLALLVPESTTSEVSEE